MLHMPVAIIEADREYSRWLPVSFLLAVTFKQIYVEFEFETSLAIPKPAPMTTTRRLQHQRVTL